MALSYFYIYLLAVNLMAFLAMGIDKYKARHNRWRIPEATLFILALAGGAAGGTAGMICFHHKTRHWTFKIGFPGLMVVETALLYYFQIL
jgi:uncharacterized membrane protein YsdA (DUF1294 family)